MTKATFGALKTTPRPLASSAGPFALALALSACGGEAAQVTPIMPEKAPPAETAAPKPEPSPAANPSANADAATCLATANATRARFSGEPAKITVRHVLVKYTGSKGGDPSAKRTREEACLRAIEARDKIREGADFDEIVKQYSDEPGAASRGGVVGAVERASLVKPFADAAFELSINQMSDVVETDFGFHIIFRSE